MTSQQGKGKEALEEDFEDQEKENTRTLNFMKLRESTEQQMHVANSRIDKCQEELKKQQEKVNDTCRILSLEQYSSRKQIILPQSRSAPHPLGQFAPHRSAL